MLHWRQHVSEISAKQAKAQYNGRLRWISGTSKIRYSRREDKIFMWWGALDMSTEKSLGSYWRQLDRNFCFLWRVAGTTQCHTRSQDCNFVYYLLFRTWHLGQDSSPLTTEQTSSPEPVIWALLKPMERSVNAEVESCSSKKDTSRRSHHSSSDAYFDFFSKRRFVN